MDRAESFFHDNNVRESWSKSGVSTCSFSVYIGSKGEANKLGGELVLAPEDAEVSISKAVTLQRRISLLRVRNR